MKHLFTVILMTISITCFAQNVEQIIEAKPFEFGGVVSAKMGIASISGIDQRTAPFYYGLNTRLKFSFYSIRVPVYLSFRNNSLRYGSNVPRFKISPTYKWASLQIGDVYTKLNPYVLDNRNMRGVALRLTPGKIRFHALYGKMKDLTSFRDTLLLGTVDVDTYSRKIAGIGIGIGTTRSFVDFYALKAWDDETEEFYSSRGANQKSNTILGMSTRFKILKHFSFATNFGISALTQDVNAVGSTENLYENSLTGSLVDLNATSNVNYAGDISFGYRYRNIGINLQTRYVQPHYQPLSVAYINTDLLDYTLGASVGLWNNKLHLNGRFGVQKNNLSNRDAITNKRFIYNLNATARISKSVTGNFVYNNFSNQLQANSITINDLYTYSVTNSSANLSLKYQKSSEDGIITSFGLGRSNFTIITDQAEQENAYKSLFSRLDVGYNWMSTETMVKLGFGYNKYNREETNTNTYTLRGSINKKINGERIDLGFNTRYTLIDVLEYREGTNWINQINVNYKLAERSALVLYIAYLNRSSYIRPTYSEIRSSVSYRVSF